MKPTIPALQEIFDREAEKIDKSARYDRLVNPLAAVLKHCNLIFTPDELAGTYHNYFSMFVGETNIEKIFVGFIRNIVVTNNWPSNQKVFELLNGWKKLPWYPKISNQQFSIWHSEIEVTKQQHGLKMGTNNWLNFCSQNGPRISFIMVDHARVAIADYIEKINKLNQEFDSDYEYYVKQIRFLTRLEILVYGITEILKTNPQKFQETINYAAKILPVLNSRAEIVENKLKATANKLTTNIDFDPESIVEISLRNGTPKYTKLLKAMWDFKQMNTKTARKILESTTINIGNLFENTFHEIKYDPRLMAILLSQPELEDLHLHPVWLEPNGTWLTSGGNLAYFQNKKTYQILPNDYIRASATPKKNPTGFFTTTKAESSIVTCPKQNGGCGRADWQVSVDLKAGRIFLDCHFCEYRHSFPLDSSALTPRNIGPVEEGQTVLKYEDVLFIGDEVFDVICKDEDPEGSHGKNSKSFIIKPKEKAGLEQFLTSLAGNSPDPEDRKTQLNRLAGMEYYHWQKND